MKHITTMAIVCCIATIASMDAVSQTRGIGIYPGEPSAYSGPQAVADSKAYRNIALNRAAFQSSSFDYNLTAQLVTDGIISKGLPEYIEVSTSDGIVAKRDKERIFDGNPRTRISFASKENAFIQIHTTFESLIDGMAISIIADCKEGESHNYAFSVESSEDGQIWTVLKKGTGDDISSPLELAVPLKNCVKSRYFRLVLDSKAVTNWQISDWKFTREGKPVSMLPSGRFNSCWMSEGTGHEWIYVDLGAKSSFNKVALQWINKAVEGSIESSDDASVWKKIGSLPGGNSLTDEIKVSGEGRYVRLLMDKSIDGCRYCLKEMQVFGNGGLEYQPKAAEKETDGKLFLSGGSWKLQRASEVSAKGEEISKIGFKPSSWIIATVPSTVLSSYFNIGAVPDIRYANDQNNISESFFNSDFWYRDEFIVPEDFKGKTAILNFDGIDWKAEIFLNGKYVGKIDGAYIRGHFDVGQLLKVGQKNVLAVRIICNANPGIVKEKTRESTDFNGGILGADNPTFHATIGWDWIPTVRGRDIGIWNDVFLSSHAGGVTIDDSFVNTDLPLPSTDYADIKTSVTLTNHSASAKDGKIMVKYGPLSFEKNVTIAAGQTGEFSLDPVRFDHPLLWWPNGYGEPNLYDVQISFVSDGKVSDVKKFKSGVREMSYDTSGKTLDIFINGRRLICNGGNWGFPEINLNYRTREYDIAVAYHADMHFTMIRNWVGMTGDDEFYEACDRHGVMVWQDFWLANPADGPDPDNIDMFAANALDYVKKIRNHPSIALYVGRNEGFPQKELPDKLEQIVRDNHPGIYYIPSSADGLVSGHGPYFAHPVKDYFTIQNGIDHLHSERGMPNVMNVESMKLMLPDSLQWPQNNVWGVHDYTLGSAQRCSTFNAMADTAFGTPTSLEQFTQWAQWINYNGYRAIYESRSLHRKGVIIWMSHPCWPSMVWQTYDYYFEPTAAYFGAKKGSAPIRIQWNPVSSNVEVVNNNASDLYGLSAYASIWSYDGKKLFEKSTSLDSKEDSTSPLFPLSFDMPGLSDAYFIKLKLTQGDRVIADNFYWEGKKDGDYKQLLTLPSVQLQTVSSADLKNGNWEMKATLKNSSEVPALMIRLKVVSGKSGERILPVFYEDNYFSLLPGESKEVVIRFKDEDAHGETPRLEVSGFNVK
jgi:hypothetical protein